MFKPIIRSLSPLDKAAHACLKDGEHSAILSSFIKVPIVIKIFILSIFEWPFYTGFTVCQVYVHGLVSHRWPKLKKNNHPFSRQSLLLSSALLFAYILR